MRMLGFKAYRQAYGVIMRRILFIIMLLAQGVVYGGQPQPSNYREALTLMKQTNRYGFFFLTADWCEPCHRFKKDTLSHYLDKLEQYYVVYFVDVDKEKGVASAFSRAKDSYGRTLWGGMLPAYFVFSPDGKKTIAVSHGYKTPQEFVLWYNSHVISVINSGSGSN